jgi:hypothetical protein
MPTRRTSKPWSRAWIFAAIKRASAKDTGEGGSLGVVSCTFCDVDLPVIRIGEFQFVQAGLGCFREAGTKEVCPLRYYLAVRAPEERDAALSSDSDGSEVHSA